MPAVSQFWSAMSNCSTRLAPTGLAWVAANAQQSPLAPFLAFTGGFGLDARLGAQSLSLLADRVGIVSGVGDDRADLAGLEGFEQRFGLRCVASPTGGERQADQASALAGEGVDQLGLPNRGGRSSHGRPVFSTYSTEMTAAISQEALGGADDASDVAIRLLENAPVWPTSGLDGRRRVRLGR